MSKSGREVAQLYNSGASGQFHLKTGGTKKWGWESFNWMEKVLGSQGITEFKKQRVK